MLKSDTELRGSDRIFETGMHDVAAIAEAIGTASDDYQVKWWWKYGRPAFIDQIVGGLHVRPDRIGRTLEQLLSLNSAEVQVTARVLPYGDKGLESYQVELEMRRTPGN
jgi:hypothetical protein